MGAQTGISQHSSLKEKILLSLRRNPVLEQNHLDVFGTHYNRTITMQLGGEHMVFEKVKDILVDQLDVEEEKVTMEASVTDDLGADSLDLVDLVMSLEEEFDVEIPDDQVENIKTVGDIVKYIEDNAQ